MVLMGILPMVPMVCIDVACHQVRQQGQKYAIEIYQLLAYSSLDHRTQNQLKEFIGQIINFEATFTAAGFFQLDLPVISTVLSTIFSYIIIMGQKKVIILILKSYVISQRENIKY